MRNKWYILFIFGIIVIVAITYHFFIFPNSPATKPLSAPYIYHWFGTDINGNDVFTRTLVACGIEIFTLIVVLINIWIMGLLIGSIASFINKSILREFVINLIHYVATLPILLIALFLLIIIGAGYLNSIIILCFAIIPTQALYINNQIEIAKSEEFLVAKRSYGISKIEIYKSHLLPFIMNRYNKYTLSRMPEIIMMSIALSFLGLGLQEPNPSLGRMLFDGLSFMFSAWWLWLFPILMIIVLYYFSNTLSYVRVNR